MPEPPGAPLAALTPLHVLLDAMRRRWAAGDEDGAIALAKAAAPYVHPRAQARATPDMQDMDDDELAGVAGTSAAGEAAGEL